MTTTDPAGTAGGAHAAPPPPPVPARVGPKVAATWTGVLMALGGILALVGVFLPYEKLSDGEGSSYQFTGIGSESVTGSADASQITPGNAGKIVLVAAVVALVLGLLVLARKGRIWVGIVALVVSAVGLLMGIAAVGAAKSDADKYELTGSVGIGATLGAIGTGLAVVAAILAIVVRKRTQ